MVGIGTGSLFFSGINDWYIPRSSLLIEGWKYTITTRYTEKSMVKLEMKIRVDFFMREVIELLMLIKGF